MSSLRHRAVAAVVVVAAMSALSACAEANTSIKNNDYAPVTNVQYAPTNGVNVDSTLVKVRNLTVLAALGAVPARMRMTLVNTTSLDDALIGATVGTPPVSGRLIGGTLGTLPVVHGTSVAIGAQGQPQITVRGADARPGRWVSVTLLFKNGRAIATSVLVQNPVSLYSDGTVPTGDPNAGALAALLGARATPAASPSATATP